MPKFKEMEIVKHIIYAVFLLLLTTAQVFAQNNHTTETSAAPTWRRFFSGIVSLRLNEFLLYVGNQSEMAEMKAHEFDMPGFEPYYGGDLPDPAGHSENYYVFKTTFSVSVDCMDKDISLYFNSLYAPFAVRETAHTAN